MVIFLNVLLVLVCLLLILLVLLQQGKGAGAGLVIGGGMSQTMFGGSGGRDFFIKLTAGLAAAFLVLCLILAKLSSKSAQQYQGLMATQNSSAPAQNPVAPAVPVETAAPAAPVAPAK